MRVVERVVSVLQLPDAYFEPGVQMTFFLGSKIELCCHSGTGFDAFTHGNLVLFEFTGARFAKQESTAMNVQDVVTNLQPLFETLMNSLANSLGAFMNFSTQVWRSYGLKDVHRINMERSHDILKAIV